MQVYKRLQLQKFTKTQFLNHRSILLTSQFCSKPENSEKKEGFFTSFKEKSKKQFEKIEETINLDKLGSYLPKHFGNDKTTWQDAFRGVFGLKPVDKEREKEELIRRRKEEVGKTETKADEVKTPSYFEAKLEELGRKVTELENERDKIIPPSSDVVLFKKLNKEIKETKAEISEVSRVMNVSSLVVQTKEKGRWEKMSESVKDTEVVRNILDLGQKVKNSETIKQARNVAEDARTVWETSQNPVVYRMYNLYESVFKETEEAEALKEFRKTDKEFSTDRMMKELEEEVIPRIVLGYLRGDMKSIESLCEGEAVHAIRASVQSRIMQKRRMDSHLLSIDHVTVLGMKNVDKVGPVVMVQFMVQQIDCMYDLDGKVVDGKEDKVVAVFYVMALTRRYLEDELRHAFVCKEFGVIGSQQYL